MKVSICVDARMTGQGGIGTYLKSALETLSRSPKYALSLLCHSQDIDFLSNYKAQLYVMRSSIYSVAEQFEYVQKIPPCALFWAPHFNVPLFPTRAQKRLTTVHDVFHLAHLSSLTLAQKLYAKVLYNGAFLLSDCITTVSEFSKNEILKYATFKPKKIEVVPPPFDFSSERQRETNPCFLLAVATLKPHKNLLRLVQAYAKLKPSIPLYLVGKKEGLITADQALLHEVENNSFLKQNVHFTGHVTDERLKELYAGALFLIFPSLYEGFGYPPLEAMACGCPVVAAQVASIPEVCGDAVEYVDPLSIDSIAAGVTHLLTDPERREVLARKGRVLVEQKRNQQNRLLEVIDACTKGIQ